MGDQSYSEIYLQYLTVLLENLDEVDISPIQKILEQTQWDNPESGLDWNNLGVMAFLEAEQAQDMTMRQVYVEMAAEAFEAGAQDFPLAGVHLALLYGLLGEDQPAINTAFQIITETLLTVDLSQFSVGLIYIPFAWSRWPENTSRMFQSILLPENGGKQVLQLAAEVLWRSHLVFYNLSGLRALQLAAQLLPKSSSVHLRLSIVSLTNQKIEGLIALRRAQQIVTESTEIIQAMNIALKDQNQSIPARQWKEHGKLLTSSHQLSRNWVDIPDTAEFTTVVFDQDILMAVEPSFNSIVTNVLVAEGDWFEKEMEWWRTFIKSGMTVIDVGANVGVYTFSAAKRVGSTGRVIAVEPFSSCVQCLKQTRQQNGMDWVSVIAGAASNKHGTALLSIHPASELNELILEEDVTTSSIANAEKVDCFTLDELCILEQLQRVDVLKIDAEGHELAVLAGSVNILSRYQPIILYENIAGDQGSNPEIAAYLEQHNYQIYLYQPFLQRLIPAQSELNIQDKLNLIAYPKHRSAELLSI